MAKRSGHSERREPAFSIEHGLINCAQVGYEMPKVIIKDKNILGGEPVFRGTRVPFKILMEYLEGGDTLDHFLEEYPSVNRELAIAAMEEARLSLVSQLK